MDTKSGLPVPTTNITPGSSSSAIEGFREKTLDAWNKFGNQSASEMLATGKSTVRAPIDPSSLGPSKPSPKWTSTERKAEMPKEFESDRKRRKFQLQQTGEQLDRFRTYMTLMERVQKMQRVALDGYNRTLEAMSTRITIHQERSQEPTQPVLPMAPEDAMAVKFFTGYKEFGDNYGLEIPGLNEAAIDVEAKPVTGDAVPE